MNKAELKAMLAQEKKEKKSLERKADRLWSTQIRERDPICRLCKVKPTRDAHHVIKRGNKRTRHYISNGIGLCYLCHKYVEALYTKAWASPYPDEQVNSDYSECMVKLVGNTYYDLLKAAKEKYKYNVVTLRDTLRELGFFDEEGQ